jgi:hypothetical protein
MWLVGSLGGTLAILSLIIGIEVSGAATRFGIELPAPVGAVVNRTQKGDRLFAPAIYEKAVNQPGEIQRVPMKDLKLAYGCEPLVSPLTHSGLARLAGRCVS